MISGDFCDVEGPRSVGFSHGQFRLVVQATVRAAATRLWACGQRKRVAHMPTATTTDAEAFQCRISKQAITGRTHTRKTRQTTHRFRRGGNFLGALADAYVRHPARTHGAAHLSMLAPWGGWRAGAHGQGAGLWPSSIRSLPIPRVRRSAKKRNADAGGCRWNRHWLTSNPVAVQARHLRVSLLIRVYLRFALPFVCARVDQPRRPHPNPRENDQRCIQRSWPALRASH